MRSLLVLSVIVTGLLSACAEPQPWPTRPNPALQRLPREPVRSPTPTRYPFRGFGFDPPSPYPTPEGFELGMRPAPTQALPPGVTPPEPVEGRPASDRAACPYYLVAQKRIGRYSVREWQEACQGEGIATISAGGEILARCEHIHLNVTHAGRDITGEGNPDVVVRAWDVGSLIWSWHKVYDLGPTVTQVMNTPFVGIDATHYPPCPGYGVFTDLDGDGNAEYVTCDDAPRYQYYRESDINPYAEHRQLVVTAVLAYEPGQGYVPAGHRFAHLYYDNIALYRSQAEVQAFRIARGAAGTRIDPLVALTLNYLYSGQPAKAWAELERLHQGPDTVLLWSQILRIASDSPFYTPAGSFPDVPVPDHYALQLWPGCAPESDCPSTPEEGEPTCTPREFLARAFGRTVGWPVLFLQDGQSAGNPAVPLRTISWLHDQLIELDMLSWEEAMEVSRSEGTACRIDIVRNGELRGHIELDTSGGFPGEVRRVDRKGSERGAWRLRGDLTWEEVPP
jgi:hypothetical protein